MKIWASILHWGAAADTWAAIASLREQTRPPEGIVVIDNASEEPLDQGRAGEAGVLLERQGANLGFAGGQNRGMTLALARGAEAVLLLNNDATLDRACLERLEACLVAQPGIGLVGPVIRSASPPHRIESAGIRFNLRTGRMRLRHHGRPRLPALPGPAGHADLEDVDALSGAALLATAALIRRVGLLRPEYFCYFEEVDWCLRARAAGLRVALLRGAEARHRAKGSRAAGSATAGRAALTSYYGARNHLRCLQRNAPMRGAAGAGRRLAVTLFNYLRALRGPDRRARMTAVREGLRDSRRRVFGARPDHPGARPAPPLAEGARRPRVAAVVLAWNRLDDTLECIESLRACRTAGLEIILVDNASRDPV
ncbi:MAG: glycosyltransferase family 2 protein, partial [Deltaproteobacteria bacterium]|nr:glycosyltransferase family 2 protein [Deltaproteobacteria bacterium]